MPLFEKTNLRGITLRNRLGLAPMSQYCASDYHANDWHLGHYLSRSIGIGLVIVEATAVSEQGAVTAYDLGLWHDGFVPRLAAVATAIRSQGAVAGIQLSHGGRKSSRTRPWEGDRPLDPAAGGWPVVAPSRIPFADGYAVPHPLDAAQITRVIEDFGTAAKRAHAAGFQFLELHAGHGRLLHSFLSPLANTRSDEWGGSFDARCRLLIEVVHSVRRYWPEHLPLAVRLSCVDWAEGGWTLDDSVRLAALLTEHDVDLVDCTSGGIRRPLAVQPAPGYQVGFAREIRRRAGMATAAVGLIRDVREADDVIEAGSADVVLMGRSLLIDPLQAVRSASIGLAPLDAVPHQYRRAVASLATATAGSADFIPEL
ncbi:NADH:flavin oxidoreductase/NADH oxidase [Streptomyces odontomachi]|uniref:NADH:flavin oxidoreductase/NADH oxidase n=1 Tax=Streptomyces odontomachi TaxID=2944940 RepID=UPI00210E1B6F|nr:NADH:flavin oxidoreductase/NADH oxidase [Streptomyces sp. ODS25]